MNLYQRVALANPKGAREVISSYGYEIRTNDLSRALKLLVSNEGEQALRSIVGIHPDKEIILECFGSVEKPHQHEDDCDCKKNKQTEISENYANSYMNAVGKMTEAQKESQLTNSFLMVSAVLILGALLIRQK